MKVLVTGGCGFIGSAYVRLLREERPEAEVVVLDKVRRLGWEPETRLADGLPRTVDWSRDNEWWWEPIRSGEYRDYYERHYGRPLA